MERKARPSLRRDSGMSFPPGLPLGKHVPLYGSIPGRGFRLRRHPENVSHSELRFRDAVSVCGVIRKLRPSLSADSGMDFPPGLPLGKYIPLCVTEAFS